MRVQLPEVGSEITLTRPWVMTLYAESRNKAFWEIMALREPEAERYWTWSGKDHEVVTIPAGTRLKVDRVYIRKPTAGMNQGGQYNSLTFRITHCPDSPLWEKKRFWAKLRDVNNIEGDWIGDTMPQ